MAFRSERSGGGIYVVPSLGGDAVLLAPRGRGPRFSPDGHWIAYWEGRESADLLAGTARVFVIESGGGQARQIGADLAAALYPVWSPAGDQVLVLGRAAGAGASPDWFTIPVQEGPARQTGAFAALAAQGLVFTAWLTDILPLEWRFGRIARRRPRRCRGNLWNPFLRRTRTSPAIRLTKLRYQLHAHRGGNARGRLAFSSPSGSLKSGASARPIGESPRGTVSITIDEPSSLDPRFPPTAAILCTSATSLAPGRCAPRPDVGQSNYPVISPSGSSPSNSAMAPSSRIPTAAVTSSVPARAAVEALCTACATTLAAPADGKRISYEPAQSEDLTYYDVARKARVTVAQRPADSVLTDGRFSPDGKWMAFHARTKQTTAQVFVVPIDGVLPVPRQQWIVVTDGASEEMEPAWSPNGNCSISSPTATFSAASGRAA